MPIYWGTPDGDVWLYGYDFGGKAFSLSVGSDGLEVAMMENGIVIILNRRWLEFMPYA